MAIREIKRQAGGMTDMTAGQRRRKMLPVFCTADNSVVCYLWVCLKTDAPHLWSTSRSTTFSYQFWSVVLSGLPVFPSTPAALLLHLSHSPSQISHLTGWKLIFPRLPICPTFSLWLSISLFVSPPMCHGFLFCIVILLPIFWGHCDSHAIINFHHLPLSASLICCVALRVSYFVYASLRTPHCHLSCWVSIDIPN